MVKSINQVRSLNSPGKVAMKTMKPLVLVETKDKNTLEGKIKFQWGYILSKTGIKFDWKYRRSPDAKKQNQNAEILVILAVVQVLTCRSPPSLHWPAGNRSTIDALFGFVNCKSRRLLNCPDTQQTVKQILAPPHTVESTQATAAQTAS